MPNDFGFIDPTEGTGVARILMSPRPMDLSGKVVGLLDNTKEQADIILESLGIALREHYGVARVVICRKEHYSKIATNELINQMASECQVAVAALGG